MSQPPRRSSNRTRLLRLNVNDLDFILARLSRSRFRAKFRLGEREHAYVVSRGMEVMRAQARKIIEERLVPAVIENDGRQTPWRGHPVFVAQHATATCCRNCLAKWHGIAAGHELVDHEVSYVVDVISSWIARHAPDAPHGSGTPTLFD